MKALHLGTACLCALFALSAQAADPAPVKKVDGILVDTHGMTVYTFDKDVAGNGKSACAGPCAANWPAVKAGDAPLAEPYSTIVRDDEMISITGIREKQFKKLCADALSQLERRRQRR